MAFLGGRVTAITDDRSQTTKRVIRYGGWNNNARNCRVVNRNRNEPQNRNDNLGYPALVANVGRLEQPLSLTYGVDQMSSAFETVRIIRVFVSSPGDVAAERAVMDELVDSINRTDGKTYGIRLELFAWEDDVVPQTGPKPQQVVDSQTPVYDIYLGIMSTRFGSPTDQYGSGTEKEFKDALKQWKAAGAPWIAFYFDDAPSHSSDPAVVKQYLRVCQFREGLQKQGLYATYKGVRGSKDSFYEKASLHLRKIIQHLVTPQTDQNTRKLFGPGIKPTVPPEYTGWLFDRCGEVELMGPEPKHGSGVRLNHVYTPLATSSRAEETRWGKDDREDDDEVMPKGKESKQLLLALLDRQSLYVSGDPGSGKSTFCRWVSWLTCNGEMPKVDVSPPDEYQEAFPEQLRGRLPVLVRLRDFWQHLPQDGIRSVALGGIERALEYWLADQRCPGMNWSLLKAHLEHGSALLILDGVDEVPPLRETYGERWYPREILLTGLAEAVLYWTEVGNRLLVTSRPYGLDTPQQQNLGLVHARIQGLDRDLQALLVRRWFVHLKGSQGFGMETANAMIDHLHIERGLNDLAVNPLLLTAMCIIYDEGKRLPHDKYVLYDRIVDTVLCKRYPAKERIEPIRGRLAAVAWGMHTGEGLGQKRANPEASGSEHEIDLLLQAYQQLDGSTDRGLSDTVKAREDLLSQSGLLVSRGGEASFYHPSIQEFLAAERLHLLHVRNWEGLLDVLMERGASTGWRNTLSFLFGCLVARFSPHVGIECLQEITKRMKTPVADTSRLGQSDATWKLAIVLGDCLQILVGREAAIPDDLNRFFQDCVFQAIKQEIAVEDRHTLAVALGWLGDPRVTVDLHVATHPDDHPAYVKIPAGEYYVGDEKKLIRIDKPYWLSKYPVTNSQYALFVYDKGYSRRDEFWSDEGWRMLQREKRTAPTRWHDPDFNAPNQPVVGVYWWEAEAFCKWAGARLPKADEVEVAARGPDGLVYPWGNHWEDGICNSITVGLCSTSAVGIFPRDSSPFGAMDVAGNVWEWCADGRTWSRVLRGGSRSALSEHCRGAHRYSLGTKFLWFDLGFRVAAVPPGGPSQEPGNRQGGAVGR